MAHFSKQVLGERIKHCRLKMNLSQEKLAEQLNMTRVNISKYENGEINPPADVLCKFSQIFSVSIDYLLNNNSKSSANESEETIQSQKERIEHLEIELNLYRESYKRIKGIINQLNN